MNGDVANLGMFNLATEQLPLLLLLPAKANSIHSCDFANRWFLCVCGEPLLIHSFMALGWLFGLTVDTFDICFGLDFPAVQ